MYRSAVVFTLRIILNYSLIFLRWRRVKTQRSISFQRRKLLRSGVHPAELTVL